VGAAIVTPWVNSEAMTVHLAEIGKQVRGGAHAVLVCDGAGWHQTGQRLTVPKNVTLLRLPPYSPELNPIENVWEYLRANQLSRRVWRCYDDIVEPAAMLGIGSSLTKHVSLRSPTENGHRSGFKAAGISTFRLRPFSLMTVTIACSYPLATPSASSFNLARSAGSKLNRTPITLLSLPLANALHLPDLFMLRL
jgi:transposase